MNTYITPSMIVWIIYIIFPQENLVESKSVITFADNKELLLCTTENIRPIGYRN